MNIGRILICTGMAIMAAGIILSMVGRLPWIGHLPGDILVKREKFSLYVPLTSSILLSILVSVLFRILRK